MSEPLSQPSADGKETESPLHRLALTTSGTSPGPKRLFMYVYYSEEEAEASLRGRRASLTGPRRTLRRARRAWLVLLAACAFAFAVMAASAVISRLRQPRLSQAWADALGVGVAVLACVQWVPQALTTWRLGHLGSLSLASLCMSAPVRDGRELGSCHTRGFHL